MSNPDPFAVGAGRTKFLAGFLVLLLLVLLWRTVKPRIFSEATPAVSASQEGGRPAARRASRRGAGQPTIPQEIHELNLAALDPQAQTYEIGRNLWSFYVPPPPPPVQVQQKPPVRVERPVPVAPPTGPPVVKPPRIPFNFLGTLGPKRRRIAVFSRGDEIINALQGDVIQEQFRVAKIGFESVTIEYVDFPDAEPAQLPAGG